MLSITWAYSKRPECIVIDISNATLLFPNLRLVPSADNVMYVNLNYSFYTFTIEIPAMTEMRDHFCHGWPLQIN